MSPLDPITFSLWLYLAQAVAAAGLGAIFIGYQRTFGHAYLGYWAASFVALGICMASSGLSIALIGSQSVAGAPRLALSLLAQLAAYTHIALLMLGTFAVTREAPWPRQTVVAVIAAALLFGLACGLAYADGPPGDLRRLAVRVGVRHLVTGLAFCVMAFVLARDGAWRRSLGLRTTTFAFAAYGLAQLHVFGIFVWQAASQSPVPWAPYLGIVDLLCLGFIGMGLVVWMLDEERVRADVATAELDRLERYDPLTGLSNLRQLKTRLAEVCTRAKLIERDAALLLIEVDRFELIAASLGAAGSESALISVAERLERLVPESLGPRPARIEGHRFAVLMPLLDDHGAATTLAGRILAAFNDAIEIGTAPGRKVLLTASVGIALVPEHAADADSLLKAAELAAQRSRSEGGNTYTVFAPELRKKAQLRLSLEMELRRAFSHGQFSLMYQPVVRPGDHRLAGFEALVRWRHPERGLQPPAAFLGAIEEMGLIADLDLWVLQTACQQAAVWEREYGAGAWVSVNATAHSFRLTDFQRRVVQATESAGLPPRLLDLELTEQTALQDVDQAIACLRGLREAGVSASLDDFGTGYSSLSQLRRLPVGRIKIDRSFIADPGNLKRDGAIVRALVSLAHGLDLEVLVEGVETEDQLRFCERAHCDLMQGYYFAPPLPAESCARMLGAPDRTAGEHLVPPAAASGN